MLISPIFFETEFLLLIVFSVVLPVGIYIFLYRKIAISRWTVVGFALLLVLLAGVDVVLLQSLTDKARQLQTALHAFIFSGQLTLALYVLPAGFAGIGINLLSRVLMDHLDEAEKRFERQAEQHRATGQAFFPGHSITDWLLESPQRDGRVFLLALMVALLIFLCDWLTGSDIRLHVLYVFPLALMGRYCAHQALNLVMLACVLMAQIVALSNNDLRFESFVTDAGVALTANLLTLFLARHVRLKEQALTEQATTDELTRLPNRRYFMQALKGEIARQQRYGGVFSLAMIDLDGFKKLNDSQGHEAGDEALRRVARVLTQGTRAADVVGRLGGDEFAVLLPNTGDEASAALLQSLCLTIAGTMGEVGFAVTASIGQKTYDAPPQSADQALQQIDVLMYQAKRGGKNQVMQASKVVAA